MDSFLGRVGKGVARRPGWTLITLALITVILGAFAAQQSTDTDLTSFAPQSELNDQFDLIQDEFGTQGSSVQVIVDAGVGGDVLTAEGIEVANRITEIAMTTPEVAAVLAEPAGGFPPVVGYSLPFEAAFAQQGVTDPTDEIVDAVAASLTETPEATALLSQDLDLASGAAEGGLVIVRFSPDADANDVADAELALNDALKDVDFGSMEVTPFGEAIFGEELLQDMNSELPMLLGISLLLIVGILWFTYRRFSDVALGFVGLIMTIVWMYGIGVLLGPDYLGITGPFSQIAVVVPVLLIGLGIDYAIHLTSRYREEMSHGADAQRSAARSIATVGGALILATITTLVGFLTNVVSPLPPIKDFGMFVAAGVIAAFFVFVFGIPAIRSLIDRRKEAKGTLKKVEVGKSNGLASVMRKVAVVSERAPMWTVGIALAVTIVAGIAGANVSTSFSQDDFIPADSEIGQTLDRMQVLFGGDVDETTYVLMEGDLATAEAFNGMVVSTVNMGNTDGIRNSGGFAQAQSAAFVVGSLASQSPEMAQALGGLGYIGPEVAPDADVAGMYDLVRQAAPGALDQYMTTDNRLGIISISSNAGQDGAEALAEDLVIDLAPLTGAVETNVVSEGLVLNETLDEMTASQTQSIVVTLVAALVLLVLYFGIAERKPLLGVVAMVPSMLVVAWVLGSMYMFDLSFNVLTATVASLAIGIGVPYGIHITHRFLEDMERHPDVDEAIRDTVGQTGGALAGSALTTAAGFGVLGFASLVPIQQFGLITALTIGYSLIAAIFVEPAALKLWANWRLKDQKPADEEEPELVTV